MPVAIMASAIFFNAVNGGLNGWWFGHIADPYPGDWGTDPRFLAGMAMFIAGVVINLRADATLRSLPRSSVASPHVVASPREGSVPVSAVPQSDFV